MTLTDRNSTGQFFKTRDEVTRVKTQVESSTLRPCYCRSTFECPLLSGHSKVLLQ